MKAHKVAHNGLSTPSVVQVIIEDGDIHSPLRKVRDQYYARANKLALRSYIEDSNAIALIASGYRQSGDRVNALIPKEELDAIEDRITGDGAGTDLVLDTSQSVGGVAEGSIGSIQGDTGDSISHAIGSAEAGPGAKSPEELGAGVPGTDQIAVEGQA